MLKGINATHLRKYIIEPTLRHLAPWNPKIDSPAAVELLLGTAAHESQMGYWLHQVGRGPALGIYQMEPATHRDIWRWVLLQGPGAGLHSLKLILENCMSASMSVSTDEELMGNLYYATAVARLLYWRDKEPLPAADDVAGLAAYYKRVWNTRLGAATTADFENAYQEYVLA